MFANRVSAKNNAKIAFSPLSLAAKRIDTHFAHDKVTVTSWLQAPQRDLQNVSLT